MEYAGLVAGLGNPGEKYSLTRHNCGFMFIDRLLALAGAEGSVESLNGKKFHSLLWRVSLPALQGTWLAAKPLTFMNDSGLAIQPLLAWHNLRPENLLVAHDELDLPPGSLRFKYGGGLAGHKGLASIARLTGSQEFYRLRIGIGKPDNKNDILPWVLGKPPAHDLTLIEKAVNEAVEAFFIFSRDGEEAALRFARLATHDNLD